MNISASNAELHDNLVVGKREFTSLFCKDLHRSLKAGELLSAKTKGGDVAYPLVYRIHSGWACQIRKLCDGRKAILDIYLPGDVIGLDASLNTRPTENVVALTSVAVDAMSAEDGLYGLMMHRPIALYVTWLLGQRQRRADRLLTAISNLDARGRLAVMFFDFYHRLHTQKLISAPMYNLPMTQSQIGSYLGLTVVHVNRVIGLLRKEQIVNFEKHCVNILNLEQLTRTAQFRVAISRSPMTAAPAVSNRAAVDEYSEAAS